MTTENNLQKAYDTSYLHIFKMAFLRKLGNKIDMYTLKSYYNNIYRSNLGSCRTYDLICVISYFIWYYISIRFVFLTTKSVQTHWENHLKSLNSAMFVCVVYYENIIEWFHVEIGFVMVKRIKRDIETNALNISFVF